MTTSTEAVGLRRDDRGEVASDTATVMDDPLQPLRQEPFAGRIDELAQLLSQSRRALLLGAGCSRCAGLPDMRELTSRVTSALRDEGSPAGDLLSTLMDQFQGAQCTIEDYMSELVDHLAIAARREYRNCADARVRIGPNSYSTDDLASSLATIKHGIAQTMRDCEQNVAVHRQFVRALHHVLQSGKAGPHLTVDYFTLNYDTLMEDALALECIPYIDGFTGGATGWWTPELYQEQSAQARVFKVHGSIDWHLSAGEIFPRRLRPGLNDEGADEPVLIWPAATKYREAQHDPYAQIMEIMRRTLRPPSGSQLVLAVCGYSFGDMHINVELDRALRESQQQVTMLVFTSDDELHGQVHDWHSDPAVTAQVRIYANRGFFHGDEQERSEVDLPWWKFEILTRLFGGER